MSIHFCLRACTGCMYISVCVCARVCVCEGQRKSPCIINNDFNDRLMKKKDRERRKKPLTCERENAYLRTCVCTCAHAPAYSKEWEYLSVFRLLEKKEKRHREWIDRHNSNVGWSKTFWFYAFRSIDPRNQKTWPGDKYRKCVFPFTCIYPVFSSLWNELKMSVLSHQCVSKYLSLVPLIR